MRRSWMDRAAFAAVACVLLGIICAGAGEAVPAVSPAEPPAAAAGAGVLGFENDAVRADRVRAAWTAADGTSCEAEALFPRLTLDSPDADWLNERIAWKRDAFLEPDWHRDGGGTWTYAARQEGAALYLTLLEYRDGTWRSQETQTIDTDTGVAAACREYRDQFLPMNRSGGLVETRYADFPEGAQGWSATCYLPRVLLDSPDAEALDRAIGETARTGTIPGEDAPWDPACDNIWYEAYRVNGMLSLGITHVNTFGCPHIQGWTFDLDTGALLDNAEVLRRLGTTPEAFAEAVRAEVLRMVERERDNLLEDGPPPGDYIAEHAQENCERLCREVLEDGSYTAEALPFYVTDTGEVHLSVWDPSNQYYYDGGDGDWTTEVVLPAPAA